MVGTVLLVTLDFLQGHPFWLLGELVFSASYKGALPPAYGNIVLGGFGFAKPRESHHRILDQRGLTAEILSL